MTVGVIELLLLLALLLTTTTTTTTKYCCYYYITLIRGTGSSDSYPEGGHVEPRQGCQR